MEARDRVFSGIGTLLLWLDFLTNKKPELPMSTFLSAFLSLAPTEQVRPAPVGMWRYMWRIMGTCCYA